MLGSSMEIIGFALLHPLKSLHISQSPLKVYHHFSLYIKRNELKFMSLAKQYKHMFHCGRAFIHQMWQTHPLHCLPQLPLPLSTMPSSLSGKVEVKSRDLPWPLANWKKSCDLSQYLFQRSSNQQMKHLTTYLSVAATVVPFALHCAFTTLSFQ